MRFARLQNRVYISARHPQTLKSHAEYGVLDGETLLARIVRNGRKWIALEVTNGNFGRPVSPINYMLLRDVKEWAMERFQK